MPAKAPPGTTEYLSDLRRNVERALNELELPHQPETLYDPVRFAVGGEGKLFRPLLLLIVAEGYEVPMHHALRGALAVEVFHNFTLVHDDIMDHAASRRGRSTLHTKWDESVAILSGDFMLALSYRLLAQAAREHLHEVFPVFDEMVTNLCEGQALDKAFEGKASVGIDEYMRMIDSKTGALIRASLEVGAALGGAAAPERLALRQIGVHLGRAFQIQDDLLDLVANDHRWGKTIGGDLLEGKKTFLLVSALEAASVDDVAWFRGLVGRGGATPEEVPEARRRMEAAGVLEEAREAVALQTEAALGLISQLHATPRARQSLVTLVEQMSERAH